MNTKRWIAVGLAIGIFFMSILSSVFTQVLKTKTEAESKMSLKGWASLFNEDSLTEKIITNGNGTNRILVVKVDGVIGNSPTSVFVGGGYNHDLFMKQLETVLHDSTIKGIVLAVNSPGGGVYESAQIRHKLLEIQEKRQIPIYAAMQNMAASGGYYISAPADKIFASEETTTGSIGVIMSSINMTKLYEKLGISDTTIKSGKHKDIGSQSRPMTQEEQEILQKMIDSAYDRFVKVVMEGRGMDEIEVRKIADGRIYDGVQAKEIGLVDEIGYLEDAIKSMQEDHELENGQVFEYQQSNVWVSRLLESKFQGTSLDHTVLSKLTNTLHPYGVENAPRLMYLYGGH
ncbi:MAG: signal peptide peptidase SppA [Bacteroidales bacterium]|nr:signal peptide peptidase SppA [Bacteroidales bacterium]